MAAFRKSQVGLLIVLVVILGGILVVQNLEPPNPDLVPVEGHVTFDNQPLTEGIITFYPVGNGIPASSAIDENGHYRLNSLRKYGCPIGEYEVSISTSLEIQDEHGAVIGVTPERIPARYNVATILEERVQPQESMPLVLDFNLESGAMSPEIPQAPVDGLAAPPDDEVTKS